VASAPTALTRRRICRRRTGVDRPRRSLMDRSSRQSWFASGRTSAPGEIAGRDDGHSSPLIGRVRGMGRIHGHGAESGVQIAAPTPGADHRADPGARCSRPRLPDRTTGALRLVLRALFIKEERSLDLESIGHQGVPVGRPGPMPSRRRMIQWLRRKNRGRELRCNRPFH